MHFRNSPCFADCLHAALLSGMAFFIDNFLYSVVSFCQAAAAAQAGASVIQIFVGRLRVNSYLYQEIPCFASLM